MKSSIRLLAFTAAFLAACSIETAHAQDRPNAFPLLREARGGEVWITPPSAPGNFVADTSIVGGVAAAAVGGGPRNRQQRWGHRRRQRVALEADELRQELRRLRRRGGRL